jgi:hypothetical protein
MTAENTILAAFRDGKRYLVGGTSDARDCAAVAAEW